MTPDRRFFRLEWDQALRVAVTVPESAEFILPVAVDDLAARSRVHPGEVPPAALAGATRQHRGRRLHRPREAALSRTPEPNGGPPGMKEGTWVGRPRDTPTVDATSPWPGLAAFREADQAFFKGARR